eukprot:CAMPEP_0173426538 /NCGR_PEP_ID=MMETSP1357-20121228/5974_1 /TAXON_ID=77926 /ORGANISM="Hemiselmis rufescens, Strain PCC563" /LENGTH=328 /DNA_ID=CAMNT_0014390219 /DNA_START=87 /DNA_END=1070 /DNA_ORIENTATION=+
MSDSGESDVDKVLGDIRELAAAEAAAAAAGKEAGGDEKGVAPFQGGEELLKGIASEGEAVPHDDLIHPEEAKAKDPAECLLEEGEWKKNDMFFEYRVKEGEALRLAGNELFKAGKFSEAAVKYRKGLYYAVFDESQFNFELQDDHRLSVVKTVTPLRLNYALCLCKEDYEPLCPPLPSLEGRYAEAIEHCTEVLNWFNPKEPQEGMNPADHTKALYRRATARMKDNDYDRARNDLKEALKLEPNNKDVRGAIATLKTLEKGDIARQKALWSSVVDKVDQENKEQQEAEEAAAAAQGGEREETAEEKREKIKGMLEELEKQDEEARQGG